MGLHLLTWGKSHNQKILVKKFWSESSIFSVTYQSKGAGGGGGGGGEGGE